MPRRLKACVKQTVGGAFSGRLDPELEAEIVQELISEARKYNRDPRTRQAVRDKRLNEAAERLLPKLKQYLEPRISRLFAMFARRIFDRRFIIQWDARKNNCQNFCDGLLDHRSFGPLFGEAVISETNPGLLEPPLYLMSFVCRPESYTEATPSTKFDVPNGLTEEYLLRFRYGRHDDADIVDTLQEYWYDWGAFGGNLYQFQDVFPWDCTAAYSQVPQKCNDCSISRHVWSFPFDAWSMIQLHLQKDRQLYPGNAEEGGILSDEAWMLNRLKILVAQDALVRGASAMARCYDLRAATEWLHSQPDPTKDRYKLGGIHRAQPWSHQFEKGQYHEFVVANWVHLRREDQVKAYEALRDFRRCLPEIPRNWTSTWERGFDARVTDPFARLDELWELSTADLHDMGAPPQDLDGAQDHLADYADIIAGPGIVEHPFTSTDGQNGHGSTDQPHVGGPTESGPGTSNDGLYHANVDQGGSHDLQHPPHNPDGPGPAVGGIDWARHDTATDSTTPLLGSGNHHGQNYHTWSNVADRGGIDQSSSWFDVGISSRPGRRGGLGLTFNVWL